MLGPARGRLRPPSASSSTTPATSCVRRSRCCAGHLELVDHARTRRGRRDPGSCCSRRSTGCPGWSTSSSCWPSPGVPTSSNPAPTRPAPAWSPSVHRKATAPGRPRLAARRPAARARDRRPRRAADHPGPAPALRQRGEAHLPGRPHRAGVLASTPRHGRSSSVRGQRPGRAARPTASASSSASEGPRVPDDDEGFGLGLSIVNAIAEAHLGTRARRGLPLRRGARFVRHADPVLQTERAAWHES